MLRNEGNSLRLPAALSTKKVGTAGQRELSMHRHALRKRWVHTSCVLMCSTEGRTIDDMHLPRIASCTRALGEKLSFSLLSHWDKVRLCAKCYGQLGVLSERRNLAFCKRSELPPLLDSATAVHVAHCSGRSVSHGISSRFSCFSFLLFLDLS